MNRVLRVLSVVVVVAHFGFAYASAQDRRDEANGFIGQSDCISQFNSVINRYGIRLDRSQRAYLTTYQFKESEIITIVQYQQDRTDAKRPCGIIKDVARVKDKDSAVIWGCVDTRVPGEVVVGIWPAKHLAASGPAVEAWKVDLKELKFVPIVNPEKFVRCHPQNRAGNDDGLGLSDDAKKRVEKPR